MASIDLGPGTDAQHREVLVVSGEIDIVTAGELLAAGAEWSQAHAPEPVRMDMSGVTFIDSSGVSALLGVRRAASEAGVGVELVDRSRAVAKVLELAGLSGIFAPAGATEA